MDSKRLVKVLKKVGTAADRNGLTAYAVGGYVRDRVMGRDTKDIDIVVLETEGGIRLAQVLRKDYGFGRPVLFPRFQTAQTRYQGVAVELVAARKEAYRKGSRKPARVGLATLKEDIARRDFTVNSLVMGLNKNNFGKISDYTRRGRTDIGKKVIRCIG